MFFLSLFVGRINKRKYKHNKSLGTVTFFIQIGDIKLWIVSFTYFAFLSIIKFENKWKMTVLRNW